MKLLNELLTLSEADQRYTLVGRTINGKLITNETKDEVWNGNFDCHQPSRKLTSLKGAPKEVHGDFYCSKNPNLESLDGAPEKVTGSFYCTDNYNLKSLKGAPKEVTGAFVCSNNISIISLKDIHKQVIKLGGMFHGRNTSIKSHVLGLLLNGCTGVLLDNTEVTAILNKYLPNTRGNKAVIDCQYELSDAGFDDFAEL